MAAQLSNFILRLFHFDVKASIQQQSPQPRTYDVERYIESEDYCSKMVTLFMLYGFHRAGGNNGYKRGNLDEAYSYFHQGLGMFSHK